MVQVVPGSVTVACLHTHDVSHSYHQSLLRMIAHDLAGPGRIAAGGTIDMRCGPGNLEEGRDKVVRQFLADGGEWLLWIDTDMGFAIDSLERLLEVASPGERPIVGGLCFAQSEEEPDGLHGFRCAPRPTLYDYVNDGDSAGFMARASYPVNTVTRVAGTGSAFLLVHRVVFEGIAQYAPQGAEPTWYSRLRRPNGDLVSEDLSFCMRAGGVGFPVYVDTRVKTTHHKSLWLGETDFWAWKVAEPATEEVDVIVPVTGRPQNAEPFMRSLRASTGLARVLAVVDPDDDASCDAWAEAGAALVDWTDFTENEKPTDVGTFAQKVNAAFNAIDPVAAAPWIFIVGDDVRFHPGWLDHAQEIARRSGAAVVGTNDMANPRVTSGEHATHLLISREYVDQVGASWDGPGVVCHEGYRHWFVDDEIVTAAKLRDVWAPALGSRVEHLHPLFGKGEPDAVYARGQASAAQDQALFEQRVKAELEHAEQAEVGE